MIIKEIIKTRLNRGNNLLKSIVFISCVIWNSMLAAQQSHKDSGVKGRSLVIKTSKKNLLDLDNAVYVDTSINLEREKRAQLKFHPTADLENFPLKIYKVDTTKIGYINTGETIPDKIMDMPLWITDRDHIRITTTLRELAKGKKFLVLDFWNMTCAPCMRVMDEWNKVHDKINKDINTVGVHIDVDFRAAMKIKERYWTGGQIIGPGAFLLSRYFTVQVGLTGPSAWIQDGKLIGFSNANIPLDELIKNMMEDYNNSHGHYKSLDKRAL